MRRRPQPPEPAPAPDEPEPPGVKQNHEPSPAALMAGRLFGAHACKIATCMFLLTIALSATGVAVAIVVDQEFRFASNQWRIQTSVIDKQVTAHANITGERYRPELPEDEDEDTEMREREGTLDQVGFLYDAFEGGNMLSRANVRTMATIERALLELPEWRDHCRLVHSAEAEDESACASGSTVLNYLYEGGALHREQCERGYCQVPKETYEQICGNSSAPACALSGCHEWGRGPCRSSVYDWREGVLAQPDRWADIVEGELCAPDEGVRARANIGVRRDCDVPRAQFIRSFYDIGWPLKGWRGDRRAFGRQFNSLTWLSGGTFGPRLKRAMNDATNAHSATENSETARTYATAPRGDRRISVLWWSYVSLQIFDILITDILFAIGSVLFVFCYVWWNVGSVTLALAGIFEIVMSVPLAFFSWRVLFQQEEVGQLEFLSIYLILCIGADDIFVFMDAWKASLSHPGVSDSIETRFAWAYEKAVGAMFATTATTCLCLVVSATSSVPGISAFGVFAACVVLWDFALVVSWFPAVAVLYTRHVQRQCPACCAPLRGCRAEAGGGAPAAEAEGLTPRPDRPIVVLLRDRLAPRIHAHRHAVLGCALLATAGLAVGFSQTFSVADELPIGFAVGHPIERWFKLLDEEFYVARDWVFHVTLVYGLDAAEPVTYEPDGQIYPTGWREARPTVNYAPLDFGRSAQRAIVLDCERARAAYGALLNEGEAYCVLNELKAWRPDDFPYSGERQLRRALEAFYSSAEYSWLQGNHSTAYLADWAWFSGFVPDGAEGVRALWNTFNTSIPRELKAGPASIRPHFDAWAAYARAECADLGCFQTIPARLPGFDWTLYDFLLETFKVLSQSVPTSLGCAFGVVLLVTRNPAASALVLLTICAVVSNVLGCIFIAGNSLSPYESLFTVLTVGLAIDYAVHVTHFYTHARGTRFEKAQAAIADIGVSILGGATTTLFAGLPLFGCVSLFLSMFGTFIVLTSFWAILFTFVMLLPLFMIMGPEEEQCTLPPLAGLLPRAVRRRIPGATPSGISRQLPTEADLSRIAGGASPQQWRGVLPLSMANAPTRTGSRACLTRQHSAVSSRADGSVRSLSVISHQTSIHY